MATRGPINYDDYDDYNIDDDDDNDNDDHDHDDMFSKKKNCRIIKLNL